MRGGRRGGGERGAGQTSPAPPTRRSPPASQGGGVELPEGAARFPKVRHPTAQSPGAARASREEPITLVPVIWPWAICSLLFSFCLCICSSLSSLCPSIPLIFTLSTGILLLWSLQRSPFHTLALSKSDHELGEKPQGPSRNSPSQDGKLEPLATLPAVQGQPWKQPLGACWKCGPSGPPSHTHRVTMCILTRSASDLNAY